MAGAPVERDRAPLKAARHRRIGLRFSDVSVLEQRLVKELHAGLLTVPDRRPAAPGERVLVSLSLPGCQRIVEAPTRVQSVREAGPSALGAMVLRMCSGAEQLPAKLDTFVHECRGQRCNDAARNGQPVPRCIFAPPGAASGTDGPGQRASAGAAPAASSARKPSGVFERLTRKAREFNGGGNGNGNGKRPGKRRSSLLNLRIFSRGGGPDAPETEAAPAPAPAAEPDSAAASAQAPAATPEQAPGNTPGLPAAPRPSATREDRQLAINQSKAALLVGDAARAISAGNPQQARRMLGTALALDPGNHKAKALLRYAGGTVS